MIIIRLNYMIIVSFLMFSFLLPNSGYALLFDARDTRVDLPILSTPNNAINPDMSADQNGHVYMVWSDNRGGTPSIYANTYFEDQGWQPESFPITTGFPQAPGGLPGDAIKPKVCSDNAGHVYVVWEDSRAAKGGAGKRDIYFRYSKDYGFTWYPEFTDERIDSDNPGVGDSIRPEIACDDKGNVYIVWQDDRVRPGVYDIYFRSLNIEFNTPVDFLNFYQFPEVRLNTGVSAGEFPATNSKISTDKNGSVYVVWQDTRLIFGEESVFPGIYFNASRNHGTTWKSKATRIDRAPIYPNPPVNPVISSDTKGNVYAAWLDSAGRSGPGWADEFAGDGTLDVYFNRSTNFGDTWDERDKRIDQLAQRIDARDVAIASNERGVISIVWASNLETESQKGVTTFYNIYANHSENFGASFLDFESNVRIDSDHTSSNTRAMFPSVKVDNRGNTFVVWTNKLSTTPDIFFNMSIDKGRKDSWLTKSVLLDHPVPPGDSGSPLLQIDNLGNIYVAWMDTKTALAKDIYNIYFRSGFLDVEILQIAGQRLAEECFIATAAYGSPLALHVEILKDFRDQYLLTNGPGQWFVSMYYKYSPPLARFIEDHAYIKAAVRTGLSPVVGMAYLFVYTTFWQKIAVLILLNAFISLITLRAVK